MTPVAFRRHLHAHPELSFEEHSTADFISEQLSALGIEHRAIAGTGILARIVGRRTAPGDRRAVVPTSTRCPSRSGPIWRAPRSGRG